MILKGKKEIKPLTNYVMIREIETNPYAIRKTASGIILASGNMAQSQETGELENLELMIRFGIVVEVGPTVKEIQVGDEVYYNLRSSMPLPILDLGIFHTNENNIIAYVRGEGSHIEEALEFQRKLADELRPSMSTITAGLGNIGDGTLS